MLYGAMMIRRVTMNYRLNFVLMMLVFSAVTYMVCMAYQNMEDINLQNKFQEIGLLDGATQLTTPTRKPDPVVASIQ